MSKAQTIGSCVKLADEFLTDAEVLGPGRRNAANSLFYAIEHLVNAALESEDFGRDVVRRSAGNHQLDNMVALLPDACSVKQRLKDLANLTDYATSFRYPSPSGRIPRAPSFEKVTNWINKARALVDLYASHFSVDLSKNEPIAQNTSPFRESHDNDDLSPR